MYRSLLECQLLRQFSSLFKVVAQSGQALPRKYNLEKRLQHLLTLSYAKAWVAKRIRDSCSSSHQRWLPFFGFTTKSSKHKAINLSSIFARMKFKELDVERNHSWIMLVNSIIHANLTHILYVLMLFINALGFLPKIFQFTGVAWLSAVLIL